MIVRLKRFSGLVIVAFVFFSLTLTVFPYASNVCSAQVNATWTDTVGVFVSGNTITKNVSDGWGNSGAASLEYITGDGGVEFTAIQTGKSRLCGLSLSNADADYASIEYGIYLQGTRSIKIYESGSWKGDFGLHEIGDILTIERVGSTIFYKRNNVVFYTSITPANAALFVDCSIDTNGGEISDVRLFGETNGSPSDTTPPSTPGNLAATVISAFQIDLSWDASTDDTGVSGYNIYRDGGTIQIATVNTTSYQDTGLIPDTQYTYTVSAIDAVWNESNQSGPVTLSSAVYNPSNAVNVTWTDTVGVTVNGNTITKNAPDAWGNSGAASLESFTGDGGVTFVSTQLGKHRMCGLSSSNADADYALIEFAIFLHGGNVVNVYENGAMKGSFGSYKIGDFFMVERVGSVIVYKKNDVIFYTSAAPTSSALLVDCAINNINGEISDVRLFGVAGGGPSDTTPPSTPGNLAATAISASQIDLSWAASTDDTGVTGYKIYRDNGSTPIATVNTTSFQDTGLSPSTAYAYTVSAIDAAGNESTQSGSVSATTSSAPVNSPPVLDPMSNITVNEGVTIILNPTATDPDGDALTYTYSGWMTASSYITTIGDAGVHTVTVTVSDGSLADSQVVTITVNGSGGGTDWTEITNIPASIADGDDIGITVEADPTVLASVKDGISWDEVTGRPSGLDDGDNVGIVSETDPTVDLLKLQNLVTNDFHTLGGIDQDTTVMGGDVSGSQTSATVTAIQGKSISATAPAEGQVLKWDAVNSLWIPGNYAGGGDFGSGGEAGGVDRILGNTDDFGLGFLTNNQNRLHITNSGNVGIGTTTPGIYKLAVNGTIKAKEIVVDLAGWPDFVFNEHYTLMPLDKLENYIINNRHLPQIPSGVDIAGQGVSVGDMQSRLLQKIEELTLYMIDLQKENKALNNKTEKFVQENELLKDENDLIKKRLDALEAGRM